MDNTKAVVKQSKFGKGVFAGECIKAGELIASFDGLIYRDDAPEWDDPKLAVYLADHAIQFGKDRWRDSSGFANLINHSCEPNCGVKNLFDIVAMRDIAPGEELTWDYEMTENGSVWVMNCACRQINCRKIIGAYDNMPKEIREKYYGYLSDWLMA